MTPTTVDLTQRLAGKVAVITGGASGIGLGIAEALAAKGIAVTVADINADNLARITEGERLRAIRLDVRDRDAWAQAKASAEAAFGPADLLFNNAGIAPDGRHLSDIAPESFERVMAINLMGVFNGIHTFGASLRAQGRGHIVNTSSMSGMVMDGPGLGAYGASKAGVIAMSEVLRMEMAPHGVGVSVLCPSYVATELMANTRQAGADVPRPDATLMAAPRKPHHVAQIVLRAIEEDRPFIFTHANRRGAVEDRHASVLSGFDLTARDEEEWMLP